MTSERNNLSKHMLSLVTGVKSMVLDLLAWPDEVHY